MKKRLASRRYSPLPILALSLLLLSCAGIPATPFPTPLERYTRCKLRVMPVNVVAWHNWHTPYLPVIPAGTKVRILSGHSFVTEDGTSYVAKMMGAEPLLDKFFSVDPPDLSAIPEEQREAVRSGEVRVGMSKAAVYASLGPPLLTWDAAAKEWLDTRKTSPEREMASDDWIYGKSRWKKVRVYFDADGVVRRIDGHLDPKWEPPSVSPGGHAPSPGTTENSSTSHRQPPKGTLAA